MVTVIPVCEDCGDGPCTCEERNEAYWALYGDEHCPRCHGLLDEGDRCPMCARWDGEPWGDDDDEEA